MIVTRVGEGRPFPGHGPRLRLRQRQRAQVARQQPRRAGLHLEDGLPARGIS